MAIAGEKAWRRPKIWYIAKKKGGGDSVILS